MTHILTPFSPIYSPQSPQVIMSLLEISQKEHYISSFFSTAIAEHFIVLLPALYNCKYTDNTLVLNVEEQMLGI